MADGDLHQIGADMPDIRVVRVALPRDPNGRTIAHLAIRVGWLLINECRLLKEGSGQVHLELPRSCHDGIWRNYVIAKPEAHYAMREAAVVAVQAAGIPMD